MLAYHNNHELKAERLERVRKHRELDQLIQGTGWDPSSQKGCAVGCTLNNYSHEAYETELGIPQMLAHLEDKIFESLPKADAMEWPGHFLGAIRPGADLSLVGWKFLHWLVGTTLKRHGTDEVRKGCQPALEILGMKAQGQEVTADAAADAADAAAHAADAARAARAAARAAAHAADAARAADAADAADAAAHAARYAARYAADAAAHAAYAARAAADAADAAAHAARYAADAADAAYAAAYKEMADKLIELLEAA